MSTGHRTSPDTRKSHISDSGLQRYLAVVPGEVACALSSVCTLAECTSVSLWCPWPSTQILCRAPAPPMIQLPLNEAANATTPPPELQTLVRIDTPCGEACARAHARLPTLAPPQLSLRPTFVQRALRHVRPWQPLATRARTLRRPSHSTHSSKLTRPSCMLAAGAPACGCPPCVRGRATACTMQR